MLKPVPLTVEDAARVVNAPVLAVVAPIEQLLIVPAVAGLMVTTPVPVGDSTTLRLAGLRATAPVAVSVVKVPAAAAVPPIAGGEARYVLNPVPLTVEDADSVVNAPVFGVVAPTVPL